MEPVGVGRGDAERQLTRGIRIRLDLCLKRNMNGEWWPLDEAVVCCHEAACTCAEPSEHRGWPRWCTVKASQSPACQEGEFVAERAGSGRLSGGWVGSQARAPGG